MAGSHDELLDTVDAANNVVGQFPRNEVHARGLMHRSVHVLLFNTRQQLFVQKRSVSKDTNAGLWDTSAAGHVDAGESPLEAAVRELHEELGVRVEADDLEPVVLFAPDPTTGNEFVQVYRATSDAVLTLEEDEIDDGRWFDGDELDRSIAADPSRYTTVFRRIRAYPGDA